MEGKWTVDVIKEHFDRIGFSYNQAELQHAVICVIDLHLQYPHRTVTEVTELLYPESEFGAGVPSPS